MPLKIWSLKKLQGSETRSDNWKISFDEPLEKKQIDKKREQAFHDLLPEGFMEF